MEGERHVVDPPGSDAVTTRNLPHTTEIDEDTILVLAADIRQSRRVRAQKAEQDKAKRLFARYARKRHLTPHDLSPATLNVHESLLLLAVLERTQPTDPETLPGAPPSRGFTHPTNPSCSSSDARRHTDPEPRRPSRNHPRQFQRAGSTDRPERKRRVHRRQRPGLRRSLPPRSRRHQRLPTSARPEGAHLIPPGAPTRTAGTL